METRNGNWKDGTCRPLQFDVLAAKDLSVSGKDVCDVVEGDVGEGKFGKGWYPVRILGKGEVVCGF